MNIALWIVQCVLAVIFFIAGFTKLWLPMSASTLPITLPGPFLAFLGAAEIAGATGLVVPWWLSVHRVLTPLAAIGLMIIVTAAAILTWRYDSAAAAAFPLTLAVLCAAVVAGRLRPGLDHRSRGRRS
jgi:uncharacterized membrane protein YphA (DoxX/SURF4 family)